MRKKAKNGNKVLVLLLAVVLVIGCAVGGTLAWLTDSTTAVKNIFTTADVSIELTETEELDLKMVPGCTIEKDPKVTVKANSEKCWLFVKVEKSDNFDSFMTYAIATGWTQGDGTNIPADVYYRMVDATTADTEFTVIKDNEVTVLENVTKEQMNDLNDSTLPTLTFTAYACQFENGNTGFAAADAWAKINPGT